MNLQSIIEETLANALPGLIQARIASGLEQALNPAIDTAIANMLGVSPKRVVAAPTLAESRVAVKVAKSGSLWKGKPVTVAKAKPAKKAKAKAKAKAEVKPSVDHKALYRATHCVKAKRRFVRLDSCVVDVAARDNTKRASRFCRVTPLSECSSRDAETLCSLGFRCQTDARGTRMFLGSKLAADALAAKFTLNSY